MLMSMTTLPMSPPLSCRSGPADLRALLRQARPSRTEALIRSPSGRVQHPLRPLVRRLAAAQVLDDILGVPAGAADDHGGEGVLERQADEVQARGGRHHA